MLINKKLFYIFLLLLISISICFSAHAEEHGTSSEIIENQIIGNPLAFYQIGDKYFYQGVELLDIDQESFEILGNGFWARDKNQVYYDGKVVAGATAKDFSAAGEFYGRDKENVFYKYVAITGADPLTFMELKYGFAKDKKYAYYFGKAINDARPESFQVLNENYVRDSYHIFYQTRKMEISDMNSFEVITPSFAKDRNTAYYYIYRLLNSDPESFEVLEGNYSKDKAQVYFTDRIVVGADATTFEVMSGDYAKDKNGYYAKGMVALGNTKYFERFKKKILHNVCTADDQVMTDKSAAKKINELFSADTQCLYYRGKSIKNSQVKSFQVISKNYALDGNYVYFLGEKTKRIEYSDPATFVELGNGYAKDQYAVYYQDSELENVGLDSFHVICTEQKCDIDALDGNNLFQLGKPAVLGGGVKEIILGALAVKNSSQNALLLPQLNGVARDLAKEKDVTEKQIPALRPGYYGLTATQSAALVNFIVYGTPETHFLGSGERAGVLSSYKSAYKKLPRAEEEWIDVLKIATGRWPTKQSEEAEFRAKGKFGLIYRRAADMDNPRDNAAITIMTYGLRPVTRNMESETAAIYSFKKIFYSYPSSASDWDAVRAIAYSGAAR